MNRRATRLRPCADVSPKSSQASRPISRPVWTAGPCPPTSRIGAIPANFTRFGDSVRFSVLPIKADDHAECCAAFDQLDVLLSTGSLQGAHRLLEGGVDPSFDPETLKDYADALAGGDEAIEAYIDHWSRAWERHANMDY